MNILGIHSGVTCKQHDPAAALICNGKIIALCEEERFNRIKSSRGHLPIYAIRECLKEANLNFSDIDLILHAGESAPDMLPRLELYLRHYFGDVPKIQLINHQMAHLASAFFCSNYKEAMCISFDGYGDKLSSALAIGTRKDGIKILKTYSNMDSLGEFYSTITAFLGFHINEDEYKIMGLAPYGKAGIDLSKMAWTTEDGYRTDSSYWTREPPLISSSEPLYNYEKMHSILGAPRLPHEPLTQRHKDIAYAAQKILESCILSLVENLHKETGLDSLCLAGGVALNCSANRHIYNLPFIKNLFVQPASSDRGIALGCALYGASISNETIEPFTDVYKGPSRSDTEILSALELTGFDYEILDNPGEKAAKLLSEGSIIGWYQGRSEYGPRALGNRSILADPRNPSMKDQVNAKIKFREEFRPFAPAVLEERCTEIFEMKTRSPYMTIAFNVKEGWGEKIPATTHVDNTARVQTVSSQDNKPFYDLINAFGKITGVPVVLNTSFNVRGQPIVETPLNALETFAATGMDAVFLGRYLVRKAKKPKLK